MRRFVLALALSTTLGLAGSALAALPSSGEFTGTTSVHSLNGFQDLVTFDSTAAGRRLKQFQFGTLGCMGTGTFPVGDDPFAQDYTLATVALVDLLDRAQAHPRSGDLIELADEAPTLHLYVIDLATGCRHTRWRDPGYAEWLDVI